MTKEEYIKKFKVLEDRLDDLWDQGKYKEHANGLQEVKTLLDQMDADPDLTRDDILKITAIMTNYAEGRWPYRYDKVIDFLKNEEANLFEDPKPDLEYTVVKSKKCIIVQSSKWKLFIYPTKGDMKVEGKLDLEDIIYVSAVFGHLEHLDSLLGSKIELF